MAFNKKLPVQSESLLKSMIVNSVFTTGIKWYSKSWAESRLIWMANRRPFVNVWPTVESALKRTKLEIDVATIPTSIVHELKAIEVRFDDRSSVEPFMLSITEKRYFVGLPERKVNGLGVLRIRSEIHDRRLEVCSDGAFIPFEVVSNDTTYWKFKDELKIAIGILMLAHDPEYCKPMLLNRDKNRSLSGGDLDVAIERARRNGKYGFDIGESIEVSPHFRRPHFAIRWTGKNGNVPKLVPVKGCFVNKSLMSDIPTGYDIDNSLET